MQFKSSKLANRIKGLDSVVRKTLPAGPTKSERGSKFGKSKAVVDERANHNRSSRTMDEEPDLGLALVKLYEACMVGVFRISSPRILLALSAASDAIKRYNSNYK